MRNHRPGTGWAVSFVLATLGGGCGSVSDGSNHPAPMLVQGGAIGGGHINGYLNVYVTDDDTYAPIAGAAVRVGDGDAVTPCIAATDSTGLATFDPASCPSLKGAVTLTASAAGYATSTAIGVNGANVTTTLRATTRATPPQAKVSGTIAGWETIPAPAPGHTLIGFVAASQTENLGDLANDIAQGMRTVSIAGTALTTTIAANACVRSALADDCNWQLAARTGPQAHFAIILDSSDNGTPNDQSDDTTALVGWALLTGLNLTDGQTVLNEALPMVTPANLQPVTATFPPLPAGMTYLTAYPAIELPNGEGRIPAVLPTLTTTNMMTSVPKVPGATYDLLATAQATKSAAQPASVAWVHGFSPAAGASVPAWQLPPTGITALGGAYSFVPAPGATVHSVELKNTSGSRLWSITIFDGSRSFELPALSPDPLAGGGTVTMVVSGLTIPGVDLTNVQFMQATRKLTALSSDQTTFMP
ncbi:MAG TPA: hypothetical protein VHM31_21680 [Polyangia bacterium]|nr:hypothetical protein [Polyangia bacterium]